LHPGPDTGTDATSGGHLSMCRWHLFLQQNLRRCVLPRPRRHCPDVVKWQL